jgi:hypothetical protein
MTITITHAKVSAIADDPAAVTAGEVVPSDWNADHVVDGIRATISAATAYYVDNDAGSDANDGSVATPWATLQHAVDYLAEYVDFNDQTVTVHVADSVSTYAGAALRPFVGGGNLVFLGNNTTLGNVKMGNSPEVAAVYSPPGGPGETLFWISGFEFVQTNGAALDFDGPDRGTCILGEPTFLQASKNKYSSCQNNGFVLIGNIFDNSLGTSVVDGDALATHTPSAFYASYNANTYGAFINCDNYSITGTVAFSSAFAQVIAGFASFAGDCTVSGTVTGPKFEVGAAGTLFLESLTQLPGSLPGTNYGGQLALNSAADCYVGPWPTSKSLQTPTTGFSITIADGVGALILTPAGTLATGTITLPANPIDQQRLTINSTNTVTALTISPNSGQSVTGNPATIAGGTAITAIYNYSNTTWYLAAPPAAGGGGGMAIGGAITGATAGSVLFATAGVVLGQNNANFYWDDTNLRLKVGSVATPVGEYWVNNVRALYGVATVGGTSWFEAGAGNSTMTGALNFGTGDACLANVTSGANNTAMGALALTTLTTGSQNIAFGTASMWFNQLDSNNIAVGAYALSTLGLGGAGAGNNGGNIALGYGAVSQVLEGYNNICIGYTSLNNVTATAYQNTIIGANAANQMGTGGATVRWNTIIGSNCGSLLNSGSSANTWIGGYKGTAAQALETIAISDGASNTYQLLDYGLTSHALTAGYSAWSISYDFHWAQGAVFHMYNYQDVLGVAMTAYERAAFDWFSTTNVFRIRTQAAGGGTVRLIAVDGFPKAGAPAAGDLPASSFAVIDDTSASQTWLVFNKAGAIRKTEIGGSGAIGGTITSATAGSVLFAGASGVLAQDNANFFWDDTNDILKIAAELDFQSSSALFKVAGTNRLDYGVTTAAVWTFANKIAVPGAANPVLTTTATITSGAGAGAGTLTNAPAAGDPTSWIPINDNGTTRYIPAW